MNLRIEGTDEEINLVMKVLGAVRVYPNRTGGRKRIYYNDVPISFLKGGGDDDSED